MPLTGWPSAIEDMPDFANFKDQYVATKFLRFAERKLSNGKADQCHNPSIKSCMLRVPGSINSRAKKAGKDPRVNVVYGSYTLMMKSLPSSITESKPTNSFLNDFTPTWCRKRLKTN